MSPTDVYIPILAVFLIAATLAVAIPTITGRLGPRRTNTIKEQAFEGGNASSGNARQRFAVKFYVAALLFIVFDVEGVFLYPWAVNFRALGWFGYAEMGIFAITLFAGLVYIWKKGALHWES